MLNYQRVARFQTFFSTLLTPPLDRQGELLERWTFTFLPAPAHPEGGPQMERCPVLFERL
jgi:hypothetical protein